MTSTDRASTPLVSVIVPIYNAAPYLDQALISVESQTLHDIEIICVNDGSTDNSPAILKQHAAADPRIRIVDKPNGGYGSACNRGLDEAHGTWIAILEPDDWIDRTMFEDMLAFEASFDCDVDIVKTPYWRVVNPDTPRQRRVNASYRGRIKPASQPFQLTDPGVTHLIIHHPSIWSALYRRSFLERTGIRFHEIPGAGWADNPFLADTLCQAESIVYLDTPYYHDREETPEKAEAFHRDGWRIAVDRWHDMMDVYERLGVTDENIRRAHTRRAFTYIGGILEQHSADEPDIHEALRGMFARLDDGLVFSETHVSTGSKELYAQVKGIPLPEIESMPYKKHVVTEGLYNLVNTGPGMTIDTFKGFIAARTKREGR